MEQSGAGLVLHVNEFMAQKIQMCLDENGSGFSQHKSPYVKNRYTIFNIFRNTLVFYRFIVMDITNSDPNTILRIKAILQQCDDFHRSYVIDQCNKNGADVAGSLPASYICRLL